jgi:putative transposase
MMIDRTKRYYSPAEIDQIPTRAFIPHTSRHDIYLPVRRSWRRLSSIDYRDPDCTCLVTSCLRDRVPLFAEPRAARVAKDVLLEQQRMLRHHLTAYTIMPDHVHLVLAPGDSGRSIGQIVGKWKSFVTVRLKAERIVSASPWQRDYDDRVLRSGERAGTGLAKLVAYTLGNPVRKGLARDWRDHPYSGCFVDLEDI